jgi:hypothetical protein
VEDVEDVVDVVDVERVREWPGELVRAAPWEELRPE